MSERPDSAENERLQELLEAWFAKVEAGEEPTVEEVCADAPEMQPVLRRLVEQESDVTDALSVLAPDRGEERSLGVDVLGDFRIMSFLGSGGMGQVHLARQESLGGRLVALKVLHATAAQDRRSVQRFRREAEIAAALDHPNIVPVYAVGEDAGYAYLAMKWLSGPALDQLPDPLDPHECARIGAAIARGLDEAHDTGVVHRDVKPGNVMLDGATPYILDFGLARAQADVTVTRQGTVPGTLPYMSPEQLRAGTSRSTLDARTDVYSLGATLYEVVSGRCPFVGDDPEVMIREILFNDPPPLKLPAAHRDLETIIGRAMDKDRERRFASAGAMADDLERYLAGLPVVSRPTGPVTRIVKKVRRHKQASMWIGGLLIGSIVLMTVLTLKWFEEDRARSEAVVEITEVLAADRFAEAGRLLKSARARYGAFSEFDALEHRIDIGERLEDLVDRVLEGGELKFVERAAAALVERLESERGGFRDESRRARWRLVRAIIALRQRPMDRRAAVAAVEGMEGRDVAAIRAHAEGRPLDDLPPAGARGVEEHVLTQVVLRIADRSRDERLREIRAAERLLGGTSDDRVLHAHATWLAEDIDRTFEAELAFRGLARDGEYRRSVLRNLIRQQVILDRLDDAERSAASFVAKQPDRSTWSPEESAVLAELALRLDRPDEAAAIISEAFETYPKNWTLLMMMHRVEVGRDPKVALAHLETAIEISTFRKQREQARSRALVLRLFMAGTDRQQIESVVADAEAFLLDVEDPLAKADALYAQGAGERRLGNARAARQLLERSLATAELSIGPINELATLAWDQQDPAFAASVLPSLAKVLAAGAGGERRLPRRDRFVALFLQGYLARLVRDWKLVATSFTDAMQLAEDDDDLASTIANPVLMTLFAALLAEARKELGR